MDVTKSYSRLVWETAWREFIQYYKDKKSFLEDLIGGGVVSIVSTLGPPAINGKSIVIDWMTTPLVTFVAVLAGLITVGTSRFIFSLLRAPKILYTEENKLATLDTWKHVKKTEGVYEFRDAWRYQIELKNEKPNHIQTAVAEIRYLEIDSHVAYTRWNETHYEPDTASRLIFIDGNERQWGRFFLESNGPSKSIDLLERDVQGHNFRYKIGYCVREDPNNPNNFIFRWHNVERVLRIQFELVGVVSAPLVPGGIKNMESAVYSLIVNITNGRPKFDLREGPLPSLLQN